MAVKNRIFIGFAKEDIRYRDFLVGQAKDDRSPFTFVDMSVKDPWNSQWKTNCRTKIKGCDGMIALLSNNTRNAEGALWEIKCANQEGIPLLGVHIHSDARALIPTELSGSAVISWTWDGIKKWLDTL